MPQKDVLMLFFIVSHQEVPGIDNQASPINTTTVAGGLPDPAIDEENMVTDQGVAKNTASPAKKVTTTTTTTAKSKGRHARGTTRIPRPGGQPLSAMKDSDVNI